MNGGWHYTAAIALVSALAGLLWTLHATDAAQTARLDELYRRAEVARGTIVDALGRLTQLEHEFDLFKQREGVRP